MGELDPTSISGYPLEGAAASGSATRSSFPSSPNHTSAAAAASATIPTCCSDLSDKTRKRLSAVSNPLSRSSSPSRSVAFKEQVDLKSQSPFALEAPRSKGNKPTSPHNIPSSTSSSATTTTTATPTALSSSSSTSTTTPFASTAPTSTSTTSASTPSTARSCVSSFTSTPATSTLPSSTAPCTSLRRRTPEPGPLPHSDSAWSATSSAFDSPYMDRSDSYTSQKSSATTPSSSCASATTTPHQHLPSPGMSPITTPNTEAPSSYGYFGLQALFSWLREHPSSSKVDSDQLARFLVVKSTSLLAAASGCVYGRIFDQSPSSYTCLTSLLLLVIPVVQGATGATRACGLWLSMGIAMLVYGFQSRSASPLLGPSVEAMIPIGLPVVTSFLVGRKYGLLTALMVLMLSTFEYRSMVQNTLLSKDDANRLWAGFGAYWVSLVFVSSVTCIYQWSIDVCVKDVNLFKDLAVANAKSKDGVVSSVSHELRTPLAALIGWTELLLSDQTLSASARSTVSMLHSSTLSLLTILNALLDVSKVSAAKMTICSQNFNLHDLVLDTSRMMTGLSGTRNVELLVNFSAQVPELVRADCGIIKQILGNLVSNAIKFTDKGYVNVGVSLKEEDDDSVTVEFVVQDTGKGIPDEMKDKLFCEFSQVEGGKCKGYEPGTGLGLFLVKNLVELMKGKVFMSSEVGVGSTFGFIIKMEKQYLAFRTPGYDHVVTVSSAFPGGITQTTTETETGVTTVLPVTPGLARSMTPRVDNDAATPAAQDSNQPKDYFNLKPSEETRANANNITLRTRDNAFLTNRHYYIHSQCSFFEDFLWNTCATTWNARETRRLSYEECVDAWRGDGVDTNALQIFGDVFLIDLSPTTNRPKSFNELTDQENIQEFLKKFAINLIDRAKRRIGKVRQGSIILFYPFGHPPSLVQEPFVELAKHYQISLCRKPVTERALGSIIKRQVITIQSPNNNLPPSPVQSWPACSGQHLSAAGVVQHLTQEGKGLSQDEAHSTQHQQKEQPQQQPQQASNVYAKSPEVASVESFHQSGSVEGSSEAPQENATASSIDAASADKATDQQPSSTLSSQSSNGLSIGCTAFNQSSDSLFPQGASEQEFFDQGLSSSMEDFKLTLPKSAHRQNSTEKLSTTPKLPISPVDPRRKADAKATPAGLALNVTCDSSSSANLESTAMVASPRAASVNCADESPCISTDSSPTKASMMRGAGHAHKRILIVDDNSVNRQLLYYQLRKVGMLSVDQASSGEEAVAKFQPGKHMLVLMDLKMPNMSGLEAASLLREKENAVMTPLPISEDNANKASALSKLNDKITEREADLEDGPWSPERFALHVSDPFTQTQEGRRMSANSAEQVRSLVHEAIKQHGQRPHALQQHSKRATIIAVTADWSAEVGEDREKTLHRGFDDVMVKPISLPSLKLLLSQYTKE